MLIAAGTLLEGKYRVDRLLGAGGMGSVWVAEHTLLQRPVAVKVLDRGAATKDLTAVTRFVREAQTAARLRNDHIVDVMDVGKLEDGTPFLVMELLEGETLTARIQRERLSQAAAANLIDQLLDGLGAAHLAGVVHRDVKPDNCFIMQKNGRDHLKLLDFGISKVAAADGEDKRMTNTGVVMGTPYYMAPEQARGAREIDHRCDLYAAAAILYECVTGSTPYEAESVNELLFKIVLEPLVPPRGRGAAVDEAFEGVILRGMGREPEQRYQRAEEFRAALSPFIRQSTGATVVIVGTSVPPSSGGHGTPQGIEAVSGVGATAPLDQQALSEAISSARTQNMSGTPPGLAAGLGTGPTPPLEVGARESAPAKRRGAGVVGLAVAGVLLVAVGGIYLATSGRDGTPAAAASTNPEPKPAPSFAVDVKEEKAAAQKGLKPLASVVEPPPSAIASSAKSVAVPSPPSVPAAGTGKKPTPTVSAAPSMTVPPVPPPQPTSTSPRPIDTSL
ncbi:MAG: protein kinase [Myxococcales bacterium]|nr:protein kinase [Myxococcales bacterium]